MLYEIKDTLKSITIFNLIIFLFILNAGLLFHSKYITVTLLGFILGILNLYLRAIMLNRTADKNSSKGLSLYLAGYFMRVILTAAVGAILFMVDKYYIFAYMGGYILHFSGVILHGFKLLIVERRM